MHVKTVSLILVVVAFFTGMTLGYLTGSQPIAEIPKAIATVGGVIGAFVVGIGLVINYLREGVFEVGETFKTNDVLPMWERKSSWFQGSKLEQAGELAVTGYYVRILKKRGTGKLEDCEGLITIKTSSEKRSFPTVWRGAAYSRYRSIGIQDDLKLFNMSQDGKEVHFFTHYETHDSKVETETIRVMLDQDGLKTEVSVRFGSSKGNVPKDAKLGSISKILDESKYTF